MKPTNVKPYAAKRTWNNDKSRFKKNYGSLQEGHGLAFLQKEGFKRKYIAEKKKEEFRERKQKEKEIINNDLTASSPSKEDFKTKSILDQALLEEREAFDALPLRKPKLSKLKRAQKEFEEIQRQKSQIREDKSKKREEIEEKRKRYKEKKLFRNKKLSQKTKRGQPLMKARMELLLNSIEETLARERM